MSNVSKCFSCARKNDYDPKFGYYGCKLSGQECKGYSMFEPKEKPKQTRADRFQTMSVEEMATFLANLAFCPECNARREDCGIHCWEAWLDWLKQEVSANDS